MFLAVSANISINGIQIAGLYRGDTFEGLYSPGEINISASTAALWLMPGTYTLKLNAEANTEYILEVSVRPGCSTGYGTNMMVKTPFMVVLKAAHHFDGQQ